MDTSETTHRVWHWSRFWSRWNSWLLAAVASAAGLAVLVVLVHNGFLPLRWLNEWTARAADELVAPGFVRQVLEFADLITDPWVLRALGVVVAFVLLRRGEHRLAAWLATATVASWPLEELAYAAPGVPVDGVSDRAMSASALTSMIVIGGLVVLGSRQPGQPLRRFASRLQGRLVVALIGLVQVALGHADVTGVVAGWLLGITLLCTLALAFGLAQPVRLRRPDVRQKRVAVILNPTKVQSVSDFKRQVTRLAAEFGWDPPVWFETDVDDAGHTMARSALDAGVDLVIAAGGDGTVRVVCSELAGTDVPIGIVPAGTGNLLVRNLGLPLDPESAIRVALTGRERRIDLVRVSGDDLHTERFAVMAGLGLDAAVVGDAPAKLKAQVGWPAYVVSIVRNLSYPAVRIDISVDGRRPQRRWARTVLVGNVGSLHAGLQLLPLAAPDDGFLDVVVVSPRRLTDWPSVVWRVVRRSASADDRLSHWRGRRVVIRAVDSVPRQLDGDVVLPGHELRCEVEPSVLVVRVPSGLG